MRSRKFTPWILLLVLWLGLSPLAQPVQASRSESQPAVVSAYEMIAAMNTLRMANGLPALIEHPIVNAVAQNTAEYMAANNLSWHMGDVRGRIQAAGYGGGAQVWATENFAVGNMSIDEIMQVWADPDHMRPAVTPAYCHVGAGVAQTSDGRYYYILQAAYTSTNSCGPYIPPEGVSAQPVVANPIAQWVVPVKVATPDAEGKTYHVVGTGQSFWAIAIAYQITIRDLEVWNNLSRANGLQVGQKLFIPNSNTEGYATPTPAWMVMAATPDADGKIIHVVQPYQALVLIAEAYEVEVQTILALNGLQEDWVLSIGQELLIDPGNVTPSPTPRPLTPIEKLTPASDGKYYHTVQSGETLSWIASLYEVPLADLMAWNQLNNASIIQPGQKVLLQVTPPATPTFTPGPPSATPVPTRTSIPPTATRSPTAAPASPSPTVATTAMATEASDMPVLALLAVVVAAAIGIIGWGTLRKKP